MANRGSCRRKRIATATSFLLDRTHEAHVLTAPMIRTMNWPKGIGPNGQPIPDPGKEATIPGVLVSPATGGATNWPPPSFDPETGLFYVGTVQQFNMFYLTDTDPHSEGWATAERDTGYFGGYLEAIDYKTGKNV